MCALSILFQKVYEKFSDHRQFGNLRVNLQRESFVRQSVSRRGSIMSYYIAIDGVQQGPLELNDLISKGLAADTMVWTEGMPEWRRADQVPETASLLPPAIQSPIQPMLGYQTPTATPSNGMAIASMVLGIIAIPTTCTWGLGIIVGILAIVFGFIARSQLRRNETNTASGRGMALAGIICGFVPIAVVIIALLCILVTFTLRRLR
jgi:hypothetical protein